LKSFLEIIFSNTVLNSTGNQGQRKYQHWLIHRFSSCFSLCNLSGYERNLFEYIIPPILIVPIMGAKVPIMGTKKQTISLGDTLFTKTQQQVLGLLFGNPNRSYYAKEIVRFAGLGSGTIQRELEYLSAAGLLTVTKIGNQKHYQANKKSPIYKELRGIVIKTFGVGDLIRSALMSIKDKIHMAFIYGSVAKGTDTANSDIDIIMCSDNLSYPEIYPLLEKIEQKIGREVNPTIYKKNELLQKLRKDNAFIKRILKQPKIFLIGSMDDLEAT